MTNVQTSFSLLRTADMTPGEKIIYIYIQNTKDDVKHSIKHLSESLNIGEKSVQRYLQSLEKKGILNRVYQGPGYKYFLIKEY